MISKSPTKGSTEFLAPSALELEDSSTSSQQRGGLALTVDDIFQKPRSGDGATPGATNSNMGVSEQKGDNNDRLLILVREELGRFQASVKNLHASVVLEIQASKAETLAKVKDVRKLLEAQELDIRKLLETQDTKIEDTLPSEGTPHAIPFAAEENTKEGAEDRPALTSSIEKSESQKAQALLRKNTAFWADVEESVQKVDDSMTRDCYHRILQRSLEARLSCWHDLFTHLGIGHLLPTHHPDTWAAQLVEHPTFVILQTALIFANCCILAFETDQTIKAALAEPRGQVPRIYQPICVVFNWVFLLELLIRIFALRLWFFCVPTDWAWNWFDVFVVLVSMVSDFLHGINLSFIRTLRFLRAVRVARVIRVFKFFRELRKIMFAIFSSVVPLLWCFIFLSMTMFMFSIFLLQGLAQGLDFVDPTTTEGAEVFLITRQLFPGLLECVLSITAAFTGGSEWLEQQRAIRFAGTLYGIGYVVYMLFLIVGVMNVLTGVFVGTADEMSDHAMVAQTAQIKVDAFVHEMLWLFKEEKIEGFLDWPTFTELMSRGNVLSYLQAYDLEPTHVRLVFDILDESQSGKVQVYEFIAALLRFKSGSKAIDSRILQREIGMLPSVLGKNQQSFIDAVAAHAGNF